MMKKLISLLLAALLLTACVNNSPLGTGIEQTETAEPTDATETTEATITDESTTSIEETSLMEEKEAATANTPAVTGGVLTYPDLDYGHHTDENEEWYTTALVDLALLQEGNPLYATIPVAARWTRTFEALTKDSIWGYDFRSMDVSAVDLSGLDWNYFSFNRDTVWPTELPEDFDPETVLEYCKNPGLGIRELHDRGITGQGVGIAIIDQGLLLSHEEYTDNLMLYEHIHCADDTAAMHGPAVSSIAVGKTIGTAPDSKLYYIAETHGHYSRSSFDFDAAVIADSIMRVLDINENLPENEKIRVISISRGYGRTDKGYEAVQEAIRKADDQGVFVITTSPDEFYFRFFLMGMDRDYMADPDDPDSWLPASWLSSFYTSNKDYSEYLWVPMGSRTYAGCHGDEAYEIGRAGGLSWAVPWLAGFYAMCCQVDPDITPQQFIQIARDTATMVTVEQGGAEGSMRMVINPAAVIEALESAK